MRGLPPVPSNVGRLVQEWQIGGLAMSTSWWVEINLAFPFDPAQLEDLLSEYTLYPLPNLLDSMADAVTPTTCRIQTGGNTVIQKNPPAHGAFSETEAVHTASGITWRTASSRRQGWAITYLPGTPHDFVDAGYRLSAEGWGNLLDSAVNFKLQLETLPSFPPSTLVLGTLHRSRGGVPLPASTFDPFVDVAPSPRVVTIRRRLPRVREVSPF